MELIAGFILGFLGSFHCVAMCGPIALSLPSSNKTKLNFLVERLSYNLGRILTYSILGMIFGFFGERIFLGGFQQIISIAIGIVIIITLLKFFIGKFTKKEKNIFTIQQSNSNFSFFKNLFAKFYSKNSKVSLLGIGILNGFLPCGFVYIALAGAVTSGTPINGALFMMLFGFGTLPLMLGISISKNFVSLNIRRRINKLSPIIALIFALIFIVRGLNLGIPYISPKIEKTVKVESEILCH